MHCYCTKFKSFKTTPGKGSERGGGIRQVKTSDRALLINARSAMSTVIEKLGEYELYLKEERLIKASTIRKINLSLSYFAELYGITETKDLKPADGRIFYQRLKERPCKKKKDGIITTFGTAHLQKVMTHIKAFVKRLSDNAELGTLVPSDIRRGKVIARIPAHLSKEEMSLLMQRLEKDVVHANVSGNMRDIYNAYLWRAIVRMLYTTGLRNFELRSLTYEDINIPQLSGTVLGK